MKAWRILLGKELLDVTRDRRTLVLTVLLPVLLYPGILLLMGTIIAAGNQRLKNEPLTIAVVGPATAALLAKKPVPAKTTFEPRTRIGRLIRFGCAIIRSIASFFDFGSGRCLKTGLRVLTKSRKRPASMCFSRNARSGGSRLMSRWSTSTWC